MSGFIARGRGIAGGLAIAVLLLCSACETEPSDPGQVVVVTIDDATIVRDELDRYLALNLVSLDGEEPLPEDQADEVKSRLLDALIDEQLLLHEAARRGLSEIRQPSADEPPSDEAPQEQTPRAGDPHLRRRALERLQEELVRHLPPVGNAELDRQAGPGSEVRPRLLNLRALMLPTEEDAERVRRSIRRGRISFDEAVVQHRVEPGHGVPLPVEWGALTEDVRAVLEDLPPKRVSRPVVLNGTAFLFQIESWIEEPRQEADEQRGEMLRNLIDRRKRQAMEALVHVLREESRIRIHVDRLPFGYVELIDSDG